MNDHTSGERGPAIEATALRKVFGEAVALHDIDLTVPRGCAYGFLGPNGAGKTTIIRLLLGLAAPSGGSAAVLGHAIPGDRRAALARVGAVVEEPRFHGGLSGRQNLFVNAAARGGVDGVGRIDAALGRVGLLDHGDRRVSSYSLGMRQRLGLARCLLPDPELLILDEPLNGLDPAGIIEIRTLIRELVAEGRTVFLSSHQLSEVERTCDLAAIVDGGRVVAQGPLDELAVGPRAVELVCSEADRAATALAAVPAVRRTEARDGQLRIELAADAASDRQVVTEVVRCLLEQRIEIERIAPVTTSLEERFLHLTNALEVST